MAIMGYDHSSVPDVWVARDTFSWVPTLTPTCKLLSFFPGTIVYACRVNGSNVTMTPQPVSPGARNTILQLYFGIFMPLQRVVAVPY